MVPKLKELLFRNRSTKQTVVKNVFWLSFSQVTSRFLRAAIIIYAARKLGVMEYGIFSYALGLVGFFTLFSDIGISGILTREIAKHKEKSSAYFATSLVIKLGLLLVTTLLIVIAAPYFSKIKGASSLLPLVALLTIFDNLREFCVAFFRSKEKMELEALVNIITNVSIAIFGYIILSYSHTSYAMTTIYIASAGMGLLVSVLILFREFLGVFWNFNASLLKPLFYAALPLAFSAIIGSFMMNTDIVILGWWKTAYEIGLYSAGQKIIQVLYTLPAILASSIFPTISRLIGEQEKEKTRNVLERTLSLSILIAIPLSAGGIILAKELLGVAYGDTYAEGTRAFQVLLASMLVAFPSAILSSAIFAYNEQKKLMWYSWISAIGNIAFNILLIPKFGIVGSAASTLAMQAMYGALLWYSTKKLTSLTILGHIKKIVSAGLVMSAITALLSFMEVSFWPNIAISGISYLLILFLIKEPFIEEMRQIWRSFRRSSTGTPVPTLDI